MPCDSQDPFSHEVRVFPPSGWGNRGTTCPELELESRAGALAHKASLAVRRDPCSTSQVVLGTRFLVTQRRALSPSGGTRRLPSREASPCPPRTRGRAQLRAQQTFCEGPERVDFCLRRIGPQLPASWKESGPSNVDERAAVCQEHPRMDADLETRIVFTCICILVSFFTR